MINFRKYRDENNCYILSYNLDPGIFPVTLWGPIKCGTLKSGELIRLIQDFDPKERTFKGLFDFANEDHLNNGIWAYFTKEEAMRNFMEKNKPLFVKEYEKIPKTIPYEYLRRRVYIP